jgi:serine/threonine protein kinase
MRTGESDLGPTMVDRYCIDQMVGSDAMGTEHLGRYLGPVGFSRRVLIKRLHAQYASDPEFVRVFVKGARVAARVRHPNVVATLDVVATDTVLYLVTDFTPGQTLGSILRKQAPSALAPRHACAIVSGVLHGLGAGHELRSKRAPAGIVHGSLSPDAILVGHDGLARVSGLGMARMHDWLQTTREGRFRRSLPYTAPELARGEQLQTGQSDVFAASAILWEALTGRPLFQGPNAAETFENVLSARISSPRDLAPAVSPAIAAVVLRGLERDSTRRFASARQMICALDETRELAGNGELSVWAVSLA